MSTWPSTPPSWCCRDLQFNWSDWTHFAGYSWAELGSKLSTVFLLYIHFWVWSPNRGQLKPGRCLCWYSLTKQADVKSQLTGKDPNVRKNWRLKEKEVAEEEMLRSYHWLNEHESEQTQGDSGGQKSAAVHEATKSQIRLCNWTKQQHNLPWVRRDVES